jgi:hypothetical protein
MMRRAARSGGVPISIRQPALQQSMHGLAEPWSWDCVPALLAWQMTLKGSATESAAAWAAAKLATRVANTTATAAVSATTQRSLERPLKNERKILNPPTAC